MNLFPLETVKVYAESLGISNLPEDVAVLVAQDLEYRIQEIAQDAAKFMRHSKRTKLTVADVNYALQSRSVAPLYGYDPQDTLCFRLVPQSNLYYVPDEIVDFDTLLGQPLPKVPLRPSFTHHWLAIEGVQPQIPENPIAPPPVTELAKDKLAIKKDFHGPVVPTDDSEIKPPVKHVLSKELTLYYEKLTGMLMGSLQEQQIALESLGNDAGINQLIPYFIQFTSEAVTKNLRSLPILTTMISALNSLLHNKHLFLEPYLHQLMPTLITCIVGKQLCSNPDIEDHWSLRDLAASVVAYVLKTYGHVYHTLAPRTCKTLLKALTDANKPLATHYGALKAISLLGHEAISSLFAPNFAPLMKSLQNQMDDVAVGKITTLAISMAKNLLDEWSSRENAIEVNLELHHQYSTDWAPFMSSH